MSTDNVMITVVEPVTGKSFSVEVPRNIGIAELRQLIAARLALVLETCELYCEKTGRLLPRDQAADRDLLVEGEVLIVLRPRS